MNKRIGGVFICVDNRLHEPSIWQGIAMDLKAALDVEALDVISIPGPDGIFIMPEKKNQADAAIEQMELLIDAHDLKAIAVVAHQSCAGHNVSDSQHTTDAARAAEQLAKRLGSIPVKGFVLRRVTDSEWQLEDAMTPEAVAA